METRALGGLGTDTTGEVPIARTTRSTGEIEVPAGQAQAQLVILTGVGRGRRFPVTEEVVIGRNPAATIWLPHDGVSRRHARVVRQRDEFMLEDLGSRNGTQVNGVSVTRAHLKFGDKITLGAETVIVFTAASPLEDHLVQVQKLEAVGRLAAGVAHEFNNLLAAVVNNLSVLLEPGTKIPPEETRVCLEEARQAAMRGGELARQMLDFCRQRPVEQATVNLSALVQEILQLLRRSLSPAITVEAEVAPDLCVLGDRPQLYQVLMNLALNAVDAVGKKGRVLISASSLELAPPSLARAPHLHPGRHVAVVVRDDGIGMDAETLAHAFEPFFTTKAAGKGTGLGLALVRGIVEAHGGGVELESTPRQGTTARIHLPQTASVTAPLLPFPARAPLPAGRRALIADDDELVARSLARMLRGWGLEVQLTRNGREAIQCYTAQEPRFDVVLIDLLMPELGGAEAFAILRRVDPGIKAWISSGNIPAELGQQLVASGARGLLHKPYDPETLWRALAETLGAD